MIIIELAFQIAATLMPSLVFNYELIEENEL